MQKYAVRFCGGRSVGYVMENEKVCKNVHAIRFCGGRSVGSVM